MPIKKTETRPESASKSRAPTAHGTYQAMIYDAILALKNRNGSSRQSLKKYVKANNKLTFASEKIFDSHFNKALKTGVEKGVFEQPKGASGGTKLAKKGVKPTSDAAATVSKKATPAKKDVKEKVEKKAPPAKKSAPVKESAKKDTPVKKATPAKKPKSAASKAAASNADKPSVLSKTKSGRVTKAGKPAATPKKAAATKKAATPKAKKVKESVVASA